MGLTRPSSGLIGRRPVRLRLTLVYSGLFLLAGAVLLTVTYGLVAGSLTSGRDAVVLASRQSGGLSYPADADPAFAQLCKSTRATQGGKAGQQGLDPNTVRKCKALAQEVVDNAAKAGADAARSNTLDHLLYFSLAGLGLTALLSTLLGWIVAGRALRPVHAITAAARRASEENLGERIGLTGPQDELKELADTFDAMLGRLDAAFASQRRFVANASHELRTPLTVMRTAIDVTLAKPQRSPEQLEAMAVEVRESAEQAETLIEALLTLAQSDRGQGPRSIFDLAVFSEDAIEAAGPAMLARSLRVREALAPAVAAGDCVLVERLVTNLIDNAVRHNIRQGWITISTGTVDGMAFLTVANSGPLLTQDDAALAFEPFRRLCARQDPDAPEGVGLGLSIVASVVAAHNGLVTAHPVDDGGLEITVELPAALSLRGALARFRAPQLRGDQGSMSSATRRRSVATCLASLASGCLPRR